MFMQYHDYLVTSKDENVILLSLKKDVLCCCGVHILLIRGVDDL